MTITALPSVPSRSDDPAVFVAKADLFLGALPQFVTEANATAAALNIGSVNDTSATSNVIGTGAKTFAVSAGKSFTGGMYLVIADAAAPSTNSMFCQVTSYSGTSLVVNVISVRGSGTKAAWVISLSEAGGAASGANADITSLLAITGAINTSRSTVAATATTTPLWDDVTGNKQDWTGTPTITALPNAPKAGAERTVYPAAGTIFTNAGSIAVQGNANYIVQAGDEVTITAITVSTFYVSIKRKTGLALSNGVQSMYIPAGAMLSRITNGPAPGIVETTTNKVLIKSMDFDTATTEYAQFSIRMPKSWDEGTFTAYFVWSHAATTVNFGVTWGLQALAVSDNDALDAAFGTAQVVTDTGGTTNNIYQSPVSAAITASGTPVEADTIIFQVYRDVAAAGDTMAIDARLHGIVLIYNTNEATDA